MNRRTTLFLAVFSCLSLAVHDPRTVRAADDYRSFNAGKPEWKAGFDAQSVKLISHKRERAAALKGSAGEGFVFEVARRESLISFSLPVTPARAIDELKLEFWVRSNRTARAYLRLVLPEEIDPRSQTVLTTQLPGTTLSKTDRWEKLQVGTTERAVQRALQLLRSELRRPNLSTRGMYVDQAVLRVDANRGKLTLSIDELKLGPILVPAVKPRVRDPQIQPAKSARGISLRLDELSIDGRPFFPRLVSRHGESADFLRSLDVNLCWVRDWRDGKSRLELRRNGIWTMATPPRAKRAANVSAADSPARLAPFGAEVSDIDIWYPGTGITTADRADLLNWLKQIRDADRAAGRPIIADVAGGERIFSRHLSLLSASRHVVHTNFDFLSYRNWLKQKGKLARAGTNMWTWIQVEPAARMRKLATDLEQPLPVVEPEQIRLQVFAALAAGYRGIGFWKTAEIKGETAMGIRAVCHDLRLLEPFLATGTLGRSVRFRLRPPKKDAVVTLGRKKTRVDANARFHQFKPKNSGDVWEASVIRSPYGTLILPVWYEKNAQFVPGPMSARNVELIVSGVSESASAWIITPTRVRNINRQRVAGGLRIVLPRLDVTAAVLLTSKPSVVAELQKQVRQMAAASAKNSVELAATKWARVGRVEESLSEVLSPSVETSRRLSRAKRLIESAQSAYERSDYDLARTYSLDARAILRLVQRTSWEKAAAQLTQATSFRQATSYQTLPQFWRLTRRIGLQSRSWTGNLIPSGRFEKRDDLRTANWVFQKNKIAGAEIAAEIDSAAKEGNNCLQVAARMRAGVPAPNHVATRPARLLSPAIRVRKGDVVQVTGWIRVLEAPAGNLDGVTITDSIGGTVSALRWRSAAGWRSFTIVREVSRDGRFQIAIGLNGLGVVRLDQLQIRKLPAP